MRFWTPDEKIVPLGYKTLSPGGGRGWEGLVVLYPKGGQILSAKLYDSRFPRYWQKSRFFGPFFGFFRTVRAPYAHRRHRKTACRTTEPTSFLSPPGGASFPAKPYHAFQFLHNVTRIPGRTTYKKMGAVRPF